MRLIRYFIRESLRSPTLITEGDTDDVSFEPLKTLGVSTLDNLYVFDLMDKVIPGDTNMPGSYVRDALKDAINLKDAAATVAKDFANTEKLKNEADLASLAATYIVSNENEIVNDLSGPITDLLNQTPSDSIGDYESVYLRALYLQELLQKDYEGEGSTPGANPLYPYRTALFIISYANRIPVSTVLDSGALAVATLFSAAASAVSLGTTSTATSIEDIEAQESATMTKSLALALAGGAGAVAGHLIAHEFIAKGIKFLITVLPDIGQESWFAAQLKGIVINRTKFNQFFLTVRDSAKKLEAFTGLSSVLSNIHTLYVSSMRSIEDGVLYRTLVNDLTQLDNIATPIKTFFKDGKISVNVYRRGIDGQNTGRPIGVLEFNPKDFFPEPITTPAAQSAEPVLVYVPIQGTSETGRTAADVLSSPAAQPPTRSEKISGTVAVAKLKMRQAADTAGKYVEKIPNIRTTPLPEPAGVRAIPSWLINSITGASYRATPVASTQFNDDIGRAFVEEVIRRASAWVFEQSQAGLRDRSLKAAGGLRTTPGRVSELLSASNGFSRLFDENSKSKLPPGFEEIPEEQLKQFQIIAAILDSAKSTNTERFGQDISTRAAKLVEEGKATYKPAAGETEKLLPGESISFDPGSPAGALQEAASTAATKIGTVASEFESAMWAATNNLLAFVPRFIKTGGTILGRTALAAFSAGALKGYISDTFELGDVKLTPEQFKLLLRDADIRKSTVASFKKIREEEGALTARLKIGPADKRIIPLKEADDFLMNLLETKVGDESATGSFNVDNFETASEKYASAAESSVIMVQQLEKAGKR